MVMRGSCTGAKGSASGLRSIFWGRGGEKKVKIDKRQERQERIEDDGEFYTLETCRDLQLARCIYKMSNIKVRVLVPKVR